MRWQKNWINQDVTVRGYFPYTLANQPMENALWPIGRVERPASALGGHGIVHS